MLEPLERIEEQLLTAVGQARRRRRRRRVMVPSIAATMVLALASGASAITGVGPVGNMLSGGSEQVHPQRDAPRVKLVVGAGPQAASMRAFKNPGENYCVQTPPASRGADTSEACAPYADLATALGTSGVFLTTGASETPNDATHAIAGITRGDATSVELTPANGPSQHAELSAAWMRAPTREDSAAEGDASRPLRAFLAVVDGEYPSSERPIHVTVLLADGERLQSSWPSEQTVP
jgi:hypothetical protein